MLICIISFNVHNNPMRHLLSLSLFYGWGNRTKKVSNLPKITQTINGRENTSNPQFKHRTTIITWLYLGRLSYKLTFICIKCCQCWRFEIWHDILDKKWGAGFMIDGWVYMQLFSQSRLFHMFLNKSYQMSFTSCSKYNSEYSDVIFSLIFPLERHFFGH